jgi:hypothetical protein
LLKVLTVFAPAMSARNVDFAVYILVKGNKWRAAGRLITRRQSVV